MYSVLIFVAYLLAARWLSLSWGACSPGSHYIVRVGGEQGESVIDTGE